MVPIVDVSQCIQCYSFWPSESYHLAHCPTICSCCVQALEGLYIRSVRVPQVKCASLQMPRICAASGSCGCLCSNPQTWALCLMCISNRVLVCWFKICSNAADHCSDAGCRMPSVWAWQARQLLMLGRSQPGCRRSSGRRHVPGRARSLCVDCFVFFLLFLFFFCLLTSPRSCHACFSVLLLVFKRLYHHGLSLGMRLWQLWVIQRLTTKWPRGVYPCIPMPR